MKGDTPLDYAEFQLTPKCTRCELLVSADGLMEKLASGFVKPFITQLRAAEVQVTKGNQVIRLETKSENEKKSPHPQSNKAWFCKGTIERFVRFVSTPEVIERVKTIEDELMQLEQVRSALVNTFAQTPDRFPYGEATTGHQRSRDGTNASVPRRFSTDKEDNEPDASKKELLRAMEARLNALHQEQNMAFSRANAAGFDNNNIADLMTFAEHFGADRLHDACAHFLALLCKKTVPKGGQECTNSPIFETPSDASACTLASAFGTMLVSKEEAWLQNTKRKLDFGANKPQAVKSGVAETKGIDPAKRDFSEKGGSTISTTVDQMADVTGSGMFYARLQQMAQQVDARSKEDFGWQNDGEKELSFQAENEADSSFQIKPSDSLLPEINTSFPALRVRTEGSPTQNTSLVGTGTTKDEEVVSKGKVPEETPHAETEKSNSTRGDAPARRLSVQAAISLFESKKKDSNEPPFRKLTKQDSRKSLGESGNSPSEKSVLKRWSGQTPCSPEANNVQEKKVFESKGLDVRQDFDLAKVKAAANKVLSSQEVADAPPQVRPDDQARENFKKSLSSLLQHDSVQHLEQSSRSKSMDANMQHIKHSSPPLQQPPNSIGGSHMGLDSQNLSSADQNLLTTKMDADKAESEAATVVVPPKLSLLKKTITEIKHVSEVKADDKPVPSRTSIDYNAKPDQEHKDKEMLKTHNTKELLPKPNQSVPHRSRIPSQASAGAPFQRENVGSLGVAVSESEQVLERKTETVKQRDVPPIDRQTVRTTSLGKTSVQKKTSSMKEHSTNLLTSSVDFHMQALVKMVEHQYTNMSFNGVEIANDQRGEQRGRFYDQYAKLREAKLRGEHPAKRAEREAKLKSMQETLERRKAEMETKAVRLSRKKVRDARAADPGGDRMSRNTGLTPTTVEQKDLKDEDDDTDQEDYTLKSQDQIRDYSNPTSPVSTPRSSKSRSSSLKLRAPTRAVPTLSKPVSSSRNSARGGASSPKSTSKNPGGAPSQGKSSSFSTPTADTTAIKSLLNVKDVTRSSIIRTGGSARVHPRLNVSPSEAVTLIDDPISVATPANAEKKEPKIQPLLTRKNVASIAASRSFPTDAGMLLGSPKDQQEGAADALDSRTPQNFGATQEAKPFLRKGRGIGPGAGPGIMKQKAFTLVESSKNSDEETYKECKQDEGYAESEDIKSTPENSIGVLEASDARIGQEQDVSSSGVETMPTANDESASPPSSRPSTGPTESGEVEALDDLPGSASENEKPVSDTATSHEKPEGIGPGVVKSTPQGSFLQIGNHKQKEGTLMLSDLLSQKNSDPVSNTAGYVTSSVSFREASLLPHGQIGSPFPASVSHPYSSMLQRGAVSSRFSPPRGDLPSSSPALWNVSQSGKYIQEADLVHSGRRLTGHQKQSTMLPLPPKEPSKGFKRLLHFGRKSRTSETTTDCVSVSTTSEGDDDADDVRESGSQLSDELLQKIRMQKRGFEYGNMGDQMGYPDQDTSQFFGSAIPPPPANFKLREEHLSGGNLIKAPRSFFSLSSFRSKGSEGKSR
ncbi:hypothetical protein GOP47_0005828 [Adiantum capillus-veneris]|uniref:Uncharacterized protein n=1 Tax=Adiantum capillus-veneris TaxID=13818 RepID=A0A9D4ZLY7_ADICA|nr:hypothetical protein GOP47_0005407 [Adiantum capillus-veneris]KAI5080349.1 hypothetical protein GOP47_0005828 [Adiantum capillus-veneris]